MMKNKTDYTLYLVTDRKIMKAAKLEDAVEKAIRGGCTLVQLREKTASSREFYEMALRIKEITSACHVPLIIDDRVDIMLAAGADGVHVGQSDLPAAEVRRLIGPDKILGVSAGTLEEAIKAEQDGADYLGVGAMFATPTKPDADVTTAEELRRIRNHVGIPIVVIGGINEKTAPLFKGTGIDGLAVVSAILAADDEEKAAGRLKKIYNEIIRG